MLRDLLDESWDDAQICVPQIRVRRHRAHERRQSIGRVAGTGPVRAHQVARRIGGNGLAPRAPLLLQRTILEGEATIVTGGTMIGGKQTGPGQVRGTSIEGGQVQRLTKGDVIVIPAGTPHWFTEVPNSVSYYVVKVIKP